MAKIEQIISTIPPAGKRGVQVREEFVASQEAFQDHIEGITVGELNNFGQQANALRAEVNTLRDAVAKDKNDVTLLKSQAKQSETNAYNSAVNAQNSYVDAKGIADSLGDTIYAFSQSGISFNYIDDGDLVVSYTDPIQSIAFNSENELIISY